MFSHLKSFAQSGVIALAALGALPFDASAAPLGPVSNQSGAAFADGNVIQVHDNWSYWRHQPRGRDHDWDRTWDRRGWDRGWDRGGWDRGWDRRHWRRGFNSGIYLNFGIPAYRYYDGYYDEPIYKPRYYPRKVYRTSSAHVQWCYDRYRSYRAWDNSWKPNHGPRRQCVSPY